MINGLTIHNFKCFADQHIKLAPLTMLVGANASGKSTVIQSLLLLRQSHLRLMLVGGELLLNGTLVTLGTSLEVFCQWPVTDDKVTFTIDSVNTNEQKQFEFSFNYVKEHSRQRMLRGLTKDYDFRLNLFQERFNYLNAERKGPQLLYPMLEDDQSPFDVGIHGEYATHLLTIDTPIANMIMDYNLATDNEGQSLILTKLLDQTRYWMRKIVPNFDYQVEPLPEADQISIKFGNIKDQALVRPTNIGFGLIYTLPIVVSALVAPSGSMLIIENPEAHLHPASQSAMGQFLACVAAAGVQVILETHSDHVLNGIRVAVKRGKIQAEQISIQYFANEGAEKPPKVYTPHIFPSGGISPWPDGFFDQQDRDLEVLL